VWMECSTSGSGLLWFIAQTVPSYSIFSNLNKTEIDSYNNYSGLMTFRVIVLTTRDNLRIDETAFSNSS
jgi:hypothetical protein